MTLNTLQKDKYFIYIFFIFISVVFFIDDLNTKTYELATDLYNILPMVKKLYNPALYTHDLYLDQPPNFNYYIPFFIKPLLWLTYLTKGNVLLSLNILNLIGNLIFTYTWINLFSKITKNWWLIGFVLVITRGILWPPGNELWGIAGMWAMVPRTLYLAIIPLAFSSLLNYIQTEEKRQLFIAAFLFGIIGNFHPISGIVLGGISLITVNIYFFIILKNKPQQFFNCMLSLFIFIIGISPFIYSYLSEIQPKISHAPLEYFEYIKYRIGDTFIESGKIFKKIMTIKWIVLLFTIPLISLLFINKIKESNKKFLIYFILLWLFLFLTTICIVPTERIINETFNLKLNTSFQLIRNIKYLVLPIYILLLILLNFIIEKFSKINLGIILFGLIIVSSFISRTYNFKSSILNDDILRSFFPDKFTNIKYQYRIEKDLDKENACEWINQNISDTASFVIDPTLRIETENPVIFDYKGASILIEGNPLKFIQWGHVIKDMNKYKKNDIYAYNEFKNYYSNFYFLTKEKIDTNYYLPIKNFNSLVLYKSKF